MQSIENFFKNKIEDLQANQCLMKKDIDDLKDKQESFTGHCQTTTQKLEALEKQVSKLSVGQQEIPYLFMLPDKTEWFSGRELELESIQNLLHVMQDNEESTGKVKIASVCGLGGTGKTSLAAEYAHRHKDYYGGGVFWFSGENEAKFFNSVEEHAAYFGTLRETSPRIALLKTLEVVSRIEKPWLIVLDDMDEYNLSSNIEMLLSGPWKRTVRACGHIIITTRRKPKVMVETVRKFKKSQCLQLDCFTEEDGIMFLFNRTRLTRDQHTSADAATLVKILGRLPLALEQACAYISQLSCSLSSYLEQYKKCSLELLDRQDATSASLHESRQRLAVRTTWLLNFEYIKRSKDGIFAVRFLHACAFFSSTEIQPELINSGKPPVEDKDYRDYVDTPLGSSHILKLLTDFSLFRKNKGSSLVVHQLVQEVLRHKLEPEETILSLLDAISMLSFALSNCASPDDISTRDIDIDTDRVSTLVTNPYLFFSWKKFCVHAQEILEILCSSKKLDERILIPETAKILYECAVYFDVISKTDKAMHSLDFAKRIIDLDKICQNRSNFAVMFPHEIPMPESLRRYIFYSCMTPLITHDSTISVQNRKIESKSKIEQMHISGNKHFKKGNYHKAIEMYSAAIAGTEINLIDPKLICDRALAYINLEQYKNALDDSENCLLLRPKFWLGFCLKALCMHGLNEIWEACSFAALAYYHNRNIFLEFQPFKEKFAFLEGRIYICDSLSVLTDFLLRPVSHSPPSPGTPRRIIVIEPGEYCVDIGSFSKDSPIIYGLKFLALLIEDCILIGVENTKSSVVVRFVNKSIIAFARNVMAKNISFVFTERNWESLPDSITTWINCCFTSELEEGSYTFFSGGCDTFRYCSFENSKSPGMSVVGRTSVESCVFSGGEYSGVSVSKGGNLMIKDSKLFGNCLGFYISSTPISCIIQNCDIFDNKSHGIHVTETSSNVKVENCRISQNNRNGIFVDECSSALVFNCEIFDNSWHGIATICDGRCDVISNRIYGNKSGGVQVVPVDISKGISPSTVKFNTIFDNRGHPLNSEMMIEDIPLDTSVLPSQSAWKQFMYHFNNQQLFKKAICKDNSCYNNQSSLPSSTENSGNADFCSHCLRKCTSSCGKCVFTKYCNRECERSDWDRHKHECSAILERSTITISLLPNATVNNLEHAGVVPDLSPEHPGLAPKGPQYAPKSGQRFIVKILAADEEWHSNLKGPKFTICDRSRTVNGCLDKHCYPQLFKIVTQCGISSNLVEGWKKKFFLAQAVHEGNYRELRVFVTSFPDNQDW